MLQDEWQNFLKTFKNNNTKHIDCKLAALSHLGLLAIYGSDTEKFLQGQCTNDLENLTPKLTQLGSHCNSKGRMLALFRMIKSATVIYLQLPTSNIQPLAERLNKYRLRSQVQLDITGANTVAIGLLGTDTLDVLRQVLGEPPEQPNTATQIAPFTIIRMHGVIPRFQILGPIESMQECWKNLVDQGGQPMPNDNEWILEDIKAGIPNIYPETADTFIPQMANLQLLEGVSFTKGCYNGQEVIARLQHLGALKRRLFRAIVLTDVCPKPGEPLYSMNSASGQGAGNVVEACSINKNSCELLAVVEINAVTQGTVHINHNNGPELQFLDVP